ncbi:MAG TPA: alpha-E domain-containing protein, partial [Chloroflexota bacterium]|nr:alpha-E domain-containing protein [Chloroflexota bacterium]
MLARVAEDLFWMSRFVERAISVARIIDVTVHLELDDGEAGEPDSELWLHWSPLLGPAVDSQAGEIGAPALAALPTGREVRRDLAFNEDNPASLISLVRRARLAARGVRECISSEMWEQLNTLYLWLVSPQGRAEAEDEALGIHRRIREGAQFFHGLADATLAHDEAWNFISLGRYLERADSVARVL